MSGNDGFCSCEGWECPEGMARLGNWLYGRLYECNLVFCKGFVDEELRVMTNAWASAIARHMHHQDDLATLGRAFGLFMQRFRVFPRPLDIIELLPEARDGRRRRRVDVSESALRRSSRKTRGFGGMVCGMVLDNLANEQRGGQGWPAFGQMLERMRQERLRKEEK